MTDNKITYNKNENYRIAGLPHIDHLEIDIITDTNTMMSALLNKEVGVAMKFENEAVINAIKQAGFEIRPQERKLCGYQAHYLEQ